MNIKQKELFQVAAEAAGIEYKLEERVIGRYSVVFNGKAYSQVRYALAAIATQIIKNELKVIED
jgi:hypothetical protein